ncbi:MAG TPA: hypothetical protein DF712_16400 [Balneola sp.]|nr:hypothetical protein [Balneola sp.]
MKYNGGWSFSEAYNLPVGLRTWFVKRLIKQLENEKEAIENASQNKGGSNTQVLTPYNSPKAPAGMFNTKKR